MTATPHLGERDASATTLIETRRLTKRFTATLALNEVDFDVRAGEVHALLGQNGAGKSTLIKILAGVYPADSGTVRWLGRDADPMRECSPIGFIHQDLGLVEWMSVAENIALQTGYPRSDLGLVSWPKAHRAAREALRALGVDIDTRAPISSLPAAERSLVAIARALALRSKILVLDEPTAALPERDVDLLLAALRRLRAAGIGIVYVTHRLDEVMRIADRVTVLRDGRRVATRPIAGATHDDLIQLIVGRSISDAFVRPDPPQADVMLSLKGVSSEGVGPVDFDVAAGETLGLVGLRGAGHHAIGRAVFGQSAFSSGSATLDGERYAPRDASEAMARGVGFVSSRRAEESVAANLAVRENLFLNPTATGVGVMEFTPRTRERAKSNAAIARFSIKTASGEQPIATLSGGNQQKVVVARWLVANARLLVLEEPTIGVDVGAKAEIYRVLRDSLRRGMAALLISSDFEEVERVCHRALVFSRGRVARAIEGDALSVETLTAAATGGAVALAEDA